MKSFFTTSIVAAGFLATSGLGWSAPYYYVDWQTAFPSAGIATGIITLPDASIVGVDFAAINADGSPGSFFFAQTTPGTDYWEPSTPYESAQVSNRPTGTDIIALIGGVNQTYRVTLSAPIKDPIMAVLSLGQPGVFTTYDFDSPFAIVSQGAGYWGGTPTSLQILPDNVLKGNEGHGTLRFLGTFSTFSWTVPTPEEWHGFTFGIRTTEAIEPTSRVPDGGSTAGLIGLALAIGGLARNRLARHRK